MRPIPNVHAVHTKPSLSQAPESERPQYEARGVIDCSAGAIWCPMIPMVDHGGVYRVYRVYHLRSALSESRGPTRSYQIPRNAAGQRPLESLAWVSSATKGRLDYFSWRCDCLVGDCD